MPILDVHVSKDGWTHTTNSNISLWQGLEGNNQKYMYLLFNQSTFPWDFLMGINVSLPSNPNFLHIFAYIYICHVLP